MVGRTCCMVETRCSRHCRQASHQECDDRRGMRWMNPMHIRHTPYAEGVRFQSPGSPCDRRTLGSGPRWLPYTEGVSQIGGMTTCRSGPFVKPLRGICQNTHR